jgi:hypothetical protein
MPQAPSKETIGTLNPFIQSLPSAVPFSKVLLGSKSHNVTETLYGPKISSKFSPISLLSTTGKLLEKVILNIVQRYTEERNLLNASQFGFRARHSTTLQCMRLTDHVTLNLTIMCLRPRTSKRLLIPHGTLACYISYLNWNFQPI